MTLFEQLTEEQIETIEFQYERFELTRQEIFDELKSINSFNDIKLIIACKIFWSFYDEPFNLDKLIELFNNKN